MKTAFGLVMAAAVASVGNAQEWTCDGLTGNAQLSCERWAALANAFGYADFPSSKTGGRTGDPCGRDINVASGAHVLQVTCTNDNLITFIRVTGTNQNQFMTFPDPDGFNTALENLLADLPVTTVNFKDATDMPFASGCVADCAAGGCIFNVGPVNGASPDPVTDVNTFISGGFWNTGFDQCAATLATESPTDAPTESPIESPTESPTEAPLAGTTASPTVATTDSPTPSPSAAPSAAPTGAPLADPTPSPSSAPLGVNETRSPSSSPSAAPSESPASEPTQSPTTGAGSVTSASMLVAVSALLALIAQA